MNVIATSTKTLHEKKTPSTRGPIWWIKLTNWEYWPFGVLYLPVFFYAGYLMLRARSFFFFSASNPGIENSGMLGESKIKILDSLPSELVPKTIHLRPEISLEEFLGTLKESMIIYPFVLKPDIGERGWMVRKIHNEKQLITYLNEVKVPFLLQEWVQEPVELGVFYCRLPGESEGQVTSIVSKEMMKVTGDGKSKVEDLLMQNPRSVITYEEIKKTSGDLLDYVPEIDETVEVVPIGNHCRGTTFLNANHLISPQLTKIFDQVADRFEGFYFGRFDIRCTSTEALENGQFKILELNGSGAEPGHIYQPGYSLLQAYKDLIFHLDMLYKISRKNHAQGVPYMSLKEGVDLVQFLIKYNRQKGK